MAVNAESRLPSILTDGEAQLLKEWSDEQIQSGNLSKARAGEMRAISAEFLRALCEATERGSITSIRGSEWKPVLSILNSLSRS
ncbi:MAG: RsbRD N-terminal domain-containing protein, partial [Chloroflexi bacterium]|nr:RsbRD N-terminal domain-containing protein [Chloroflexota bacterium]